MLTDSQIQLFRDRLTESFFITPQDAEYAEAIKRWNDVGERRAGGIILATSAEDISVAMKLAVDIQLDVAVRGGGHSHFAASSTDGGIVIDLRNMNNVTINEATNVVTVQGGALWSDVDETLGQKGLAAVGGTVNHTGVGGLTLGGGYGWLSGQYGLAIDNLLSAKVVLAEGSIVTASATSHQDLFWAIRGGGGNFGVAVEFVFQAYEKPDNVFAGMLVYTLDKVPEIAKFLNGWSSNQQRNECVLLAVVAPPPQNQPAIAVVPFYDGPEHAARDRFSKLIAIGPIADGTSMLAYSKVNSLLLDGAKHGGRKFQAGTVWEPPFVLAQLDQVIHEFRGMLEAYPETAGSAVIFQFDHPEKIASVPHDATAFANRGNHRLAMVEVKFGSRDLDDVALKYAKRIVQIIKGWDNGGPGRERGVKIYSNYATGDEDPRQIFGSNFERLAEIKKVYDPGNVFNKWFPISPCQRSLG
ncbi:FAD-binding oxidoreductase [Aspergillus tanneri]|uniref:FAD-binding PCMH-type domain-containing protein n=1 Tax=Aspergillus tanneri TaxID=1220188 RepID=A0A5M9MU15_9EURO|nr:uncharacterized protein ATNIH1004_002117 [Aspergillus tanneri]KAA8649446.1 hypothetical protein ATNIH1004_002117 [Aspergillus tanneri]